MKINKSWHSEFKSLSERHQALELRYLREVTERLEARESQGNDSCTECDQRKEERGRENDVEVLKQQLIVYKEDFLQEQDENKKLRKQNDKLQEQLLQLTRVNETLTKEKSHYKRNFEHVNREKSYIVDELKRLSSSNPYAHRSHYDIR